MKGCPYNKFDFKVMEEKCKVTDELTHNALLCDFDYEECPHYKRKQISESTPCRQDV